MTGPTRRTSISLRSAFAEFVRHPSPWALGLPLIGALVARVVVGGWAISDAVLPIVMLAVYPFLEWAIHVVILHWRPRRVGGVMIDSLLARKHRQHHVDPRDVGLVFIPWQTLPAMVAADVAIGVFAFTRLGLGLTFTCMALAIGFAYEWIHHLIHTDYRPRHGLYRAVWRNHRMHHFKNEHYWFTVTSSGTADRALRTYPDAAQVTTSPTARSLHGLIDAP